MRKINLFNDNYIFEKEGVTEKVTLPHTWNAQMDRAHPIITEESVFTQRNLQNRNFRMESSYILK